MRPRHRTCIGSVRPAQRPVVATRYLRQDLTLRPLGYEDSATPVYPCAAATDSGRILRPNGTSTRLNVGLARIGCRRSECSGPRSGFRGTRSRHPRRPEPGSSHARPPHMRSGWPGPASTPGMSAWLCAMSRRARCQCPGSTRESTYRPLRARPCTARSAGVMNGHKGKVILPQPDLYASIIRATRRPTQRRIRRLRARLHHGRQLREVIALSATGQLGMAAAGQIQIQLAVVSQPLF